MLNERNCLSFTTDTWTTEHTIQSFMGLTCHWLSDTFVRHSELLQCSAFDKHHTTQNLSSTFEMMPEKWNINRDKRRVVLCHDISDPDQTQSSVTHECLSVPDL